jgi:hypothetical protein
VWPGNIGIAKSASIVAWPHGHGNVVGYGGPDGFFDFLPVLMDRVLSFAMNSESSLPFDVAFIDLLSQWVGWRRELNQKVHAENGGEIPILWRRFPFAPVANDGVVTNGASITRGIPQSELRARPFGRAMLAATSAYAVFNRRLRQNLDHLAGFGPSNLLEVSLDVHWRGGVLGSRYVSFACDYSCFVADRRASNLAL